MGDVTGIAWTDRTWNPWHGCHKISPGCKNCYMFREKLQYGQNPNVVVRSKTTFNAPLKWEREVMARARAVGTKTTAPLVFTCSWSDWFIEEADAWRDDAYEIIRRTPHLTYQILTKRHDRIAGRVPTDITNAMFGVSVEDQARANVRIPALLASGAPRPFVSLEPLLELVTIPREWLRRLSWGIVGGESGAGRRDCGVAAITSVVTQFVDAGIPIFVKQDCAFKSGQQGRIPDEYFLQQRPTGGAA